MLVQPIHYQWSLRNREPFIADETSPYRVESLRAADGHAIPFPRRILQWDNYWRADRCSVTLFLQDGRWPHPGASYEMEIVLHGYNRTISEEVERRMRQWIPTPRNFRGGPVDAALRILRAPALGTGESRWEDSVRLVHDVDTEQVGQRRGESPSAARVMVRATLRTVTVHYTTLFPQPE